MKRTAITALTLLAFPLLVSAAAPGTPLPTPDAETPEEFLCGIKTDRHVTITMSDGRTFGRVSVKQSDFQPWVEIAYGYVAIPSAGRPARGSGGTTWIQAGQISSMTFSDAAETARVRRPPVPPIRATDAQTQRNSAARIPPNPRTRRPPLPPSRASASKAQPNTADSSPADPGTRRQPLPLPRKTEPEPDPVKEGEPPR